MRKVSASPYHGNMKARRLLDRGRLQFFYHSPSSKLPIRDILNEQGHGWKKEPYLEKKAENYCVRCYQVNIRKMKSNRERYLFLFTRCAYKPLKECWGNRCIVGYLRVRRFEKRWTYKRSRRKYHWAAVGDVRLVRFQDSFPLKDLVGKASAAHIRMKCLDPAQTQMLVSFFRKQENVFGQCLRAIHELKKKLPPGKRRCESSSCA